MTDRSSAAAPPAPVDVLIVDDHPVFRRGLASLVSSDPALRVVGEASSGGEAIELFHRVRPAVTLLDLKMPGIGGLEALATILKSAPTARVAVISSYDGDADIQRVLAAGARAYLLKDTPDHEILRAIHTVHGGGRYVPPAVAERLAKALPQPDLSPRELDVLKLIARGMSNRAIAEDLGIEENTAKVHVRNILSKLGVEQRTEAAVVAIQRGIVHLD